MACVVKRRGKWVVDFRDQNGRRRWETFETRKQADAALAKRIGEVKGGVYKAPADLPTFQTVAERWLDGKRDRAASTHRILSGLVRLHYVPAFGPRRIDTITAADVERFRNERRDQMAPISVNQLLQHLGAIFSYALRHNLIVKNPADRALVDRVRKPRLADQVAEAIDPRSVLTGPQAHQLIAAAKSGVYRMFITLSVLTGCRSGELLALPWGHVDLDQRKLRVSRSLSWDRSNGKGKPVFGPPKTDSSYRTLDMAPELVAMLREWKLRSPYKSDADLVFTNQAGGPLHLGYIRRGLDVALAACPTLPHVSPHELRHTFASLLLQMNKPVTQVAKLLGHKDPSITLTVYSHWFDDAEERNRETMGALAATVLAPNGSKTVATAGA
jgi:integrase